MTRALFFLVLILVSAVVVSVREMQRRDAHLQQLNQSLDLCEFMCEGRKFAP